MLVKPGLHTENELSRSRLSQVTALQTDIHTTQADATETIPHSRVVITFHINSKVFGVSKFKYAI